MRDNLLKIADFADEAIEIIEMGEIWPRLSNFIIFLDEKYKIKRNCKWFLIQLRDDRNITEVRTHMNMKEYSWWTIVASWKCANLEEFDTQWRFVIWILRSRINDFYYFFNIWVFEKSRI